MDDISIVDVTFPERLITRKNTLKMSDKMHALSSLHKQNRFAR